MRNRREACPATNCGCGTALGNAGIDRRSIAKPAETVKPAVPAPSGTSETITALPLEPAAKGDPHLGQRGDFCDWLGPPLGVALTVEQTLPAVLPADATEESTGD